MTKAQEWRAKGLESAQAEAQPLELPSGMTILARRPGPAFVANYARLPLTLASKLSEDQPLAVGSTRESSDQPGFAEFLRDLLVYTVVEPGISLTPTPDQVHPRDIPNEDVEFIIGWALRRHEAESLSTFRAQRNDGPAGADGGSVPPAAVEPAGHPGSDAGAGLRPGGDGRPGPA